MTLRGDQAKGHVMVGGAALGVLDAVQMYAFFVALRYMDVAPAVLLSYMSPIYIAILAPRLLKQQAERAVVGALLPALAGITLMLLPGLLVPDLRVSAVGVAAGLVAGLALAFFFLVAKDLCAHVGATRCSSGTVCSWVSSCCRSAWCRR
ncbi:MAG: hypothetical protein FJ000_00075 [Actinobacteria bacterium]|nr:hypothetical protein [Actinomycetota bacterium]